MLRWLWGLRCQWLGPGLGSLQDLKHLGLQRHGQRRVELLVLLREEGSAVRRAVGDERGGGDEPFGTAFLSPGDAWAQETPEKILSADE